MDLDQLNTFLEIVRLKSFSKAAQVVYRTQPAISAQIRQLELELNTTLFHRHGSKISLTPAGKIFAEYARKILELKRQAEEAIAELERSPKGELVIAASEAVCIYILPKIFAQYRQAYPQVQLSIERSYGQQIVRLVLDHVVDFGIVQLPVHERKLQTAPFFEDEIKLIVPVNHPLASQDSVSARDIVGYPLLLPRSGTTRSRLDEWLERVEDEIQVSMELDSTEMLKRFVKEGLGISFLAETYCQDEVAQGVIKTLSLAPEPMIRRLGLIYRKDKALTKSALGFIDLVMQHSLVR